MKNKILVALLLLACSVGLAQQKVVWENLAEVTYVKKYFPEYGEYFMYPKFSDSVKALEGKKIIITGYFLNIDPEGKLYVLSKGPMASCFFCGIGGPETAIEVQFKSPPNYKTDDIVTITGTLKLNSEDVEHFNYILTNSEAKLVK